MTTPVDDRGAPDRAAAQLDELRVGLQGIGDVPIADRPAMLEAANEALVSALSSLEEG
ncbi:MAG: hypothetical protein ACI867_002089 [Glaciecola sp.]